MQLQLSIFVRPLLVLLICGFITFSLPEVAAAANGIVTCEGTDCNFCHLVELTNLVVQWIVTISTLLIVAVMAYAGFKLVTSGGNQTAYSDAKKYFVNAVIGLIVLMAAWTIVDTLLKTLAGGDLGVWNPPAECGGQNNPTEYESDGDGNFEGEPFDPGVPEDFFGDEDDPFGSDGLTATEYQEQGFQLVQCAAENCILWCEQNFRRSVVRSGVQLGLTPPTALWCVVPPALPCDSMGVNGVCQDDVVADETADGSLDFDGGIQAQLMHASAPLSALLSCLANNLPGNVGRVTSISDSLIVGGQRTFAQCAQGGCAHTAGSRHYGGSGACMGESYAVDLGDEENINVICTTARSCNSTVRDCSVHNGNHVHIDLPFTCPGAGLQ